MSNSTPKGLDDPLLRDLGRWVRQKRALEDDDSVYEPMSPERQAMIVDDLLGPPSEDGGATKRRSETDTEHLDPSQTEPTDRQDDSEPSDSPIDDSERPEPSDSPIDDSDPPEPSDRPSHDPKGERPVPSTEPSDSRAHDPKTEASGSTPDPPLATRSVPPRLSHPTPTSDPTLATHAVTTEASAAASPTKVSDPGALAANTVASVISAEPQASANRPGRLFRAGGYLATAAAAAAVVALARPDGDSAVRTPAAESSSEAVASSAKPPFSSWRIDGGGPSADHLGPEDEPMVAVCPSKSLVLNLAVTPDQEIDHASPLQLVLNATPAEGAGYWFVFEIDRDEHFSWTEDGHAVSYTGPLEEIAPLPPGKWTLQPSLGAPGVCISRDHRACTPLKAQTIEVVADEKRCEPAQ